MVITPKVITIFTVISMETLTYNQIQSDKPNFHFFCFFNYSKSKGKFGKQKNC